MNTSPQSLPESDHHYYSLSLPNCWQMEDELPPKIISRFNRLAKEQGISVYRAFARDAQSHLEDFFKTQGIKSTTTLTYDNLHDPTQGYLLFKNLGRVPNLKASLRIAFKDVALAEKAIRINLGDRIEIQHTSPNDRNDHTWDFPY